jgi:hypothetical protein
MVELSLVPLIGLPLAAVLWRTDLAARKRIAWRTLLILMVGGCAALAFFFLRAFSGGNDLLAVAGALAAIGLGFGIPLAHLEGDVDPSWIAVLTQASIPALLLLLASFEQVRWLGLAMALWLAVLVVAVAALVRVRDRMRPWIVRGGAVALGLLLSPPALAVIQPPGANVDVVTRDAALWLREHDGGGESVLLAAPTATTKMIWFGGFRGIGTLYWENLEGLRRSAAIYRAPDADAARALLAQSGVTRLAYFAWDAGAGALDLAAAVADGVDEEQWTPGFLDRLPFDVVAGRFDELPVWLTPLPYVPPKVTGYQHPAVLLFEVDEGQAPDVAAARLAEFYRAIGDTEAMERALARSSTTR